MTRLQRCAATVAAVIVALGAAAAAAEPARPLSVVGAEAVFPLAVAAGERFSARSGQPMPVVERSGTAQGFKLLCAGSGPRHPDIATAERQASRGELSVCSHKSIALGEVKLGYQAVALAQPPGAPALALTRRQVFLALAAEVPVDGRMVANPYRLWSDIDFTLPVKPIEVFGPPQTSPLWNSFVELVMARAADDLPDLRAWRPEQRAALAGVLRADGVFTMLAEDETSVARELARRPQALGIVSFNFLTAQGGALRGVALDGVAPDLAAIADGRYPAARALFLYVKQAQLGAAPGLRDYLAEITGPAASGPGGYLTARGLVALPPHERAAAGGLTPLR